MKGDPAVSGGPLTSKPTSPNIRRCSGSSAFFSGPRMVAASKDEFDEPVHFDHSPADRSGGDDLRGTPHRAPAPIGERGAERRHGGDHTARGPVARREGFSQKSGRRRPGAGISPPLVQHLLRTIAPRNQEDFRGGAAPGGRGRLD